MYMHAYIAIGSYLTIKLLDLNVHYYNKKYIYVHYILSFMYNRSFSNIDLQSVYGCHVYTVRSAVYICSYTQLHT